ncbi:hypothetical protein ASPWEDRAFT_121155 [Aspergillus wentii DTO 134E9]|uniref:Uncharacterized protein n=1 Tax=Aspergillus wentii DTO 134E9 TaxID=1073089 RepID=A0A1L9R5T1_ASPWE|nr:uncharacterized protein ASPWEDRAFT_121155 [Aspergillus wentii DTO 134E9]KAI9925231.1 hypothetical protein MW887_006151 [Aspergillus wentii]OJJ30275.1 hypothetical protein ASPWEDRAFT_121155 [Aspergillus wentii DTO 134E9]
MPLKQLRRCSHQSICQNSSSHATAAGYKQPTQQQRIAATKPTAAPSTRRIKSSALKHDSKQFPAPLVLPDDDLALDPDYPAQSFQKWLDEEDRNEITPTKRTVYVVAPPGIDDECTFVQSWTEPQKGDDKHRITTPRTQDIVDYLAAFYHGLPVKLLPVPDFRFVPWDEGKKSSKTAPRYVGLAISEECVRIGTRACPDKIYPRQLNLDDLLDVAMGILPDDAYALCMLVNHDLFEDADDTFVCGRAYGGSRVAVVSSARYCPNIDIIQSVERQHAWPASHCKAYMQECCTSGWVGLKKQRTSKDDPSSTQNPPLEAALASYSKLPDIDSFPALLSALWLARMCRTASHELGHCFGIDHCVYYACIMQGSASLSEDARQPPYLCPIDLSKILHATGTTSSDRYRSLLEYCQRPENSDTHVFSSFASWLSVVLEEARL